MCFERLLELDLFRVTLRMKDFRLYTKCLLGNCGRLVSGTGLPLTPGEVKLDRSAREMAGDAYLRS